MGEEVDYGIPVLQARGRSLAEAWENSMLELYKNGGRALTEYDTPEDQRSIDATMGIVVEDPSSEPFIHKGFPGGLEDLEEYRQEGMDGIKDHWVRDLHNPLDDKWEYTYHQRLRAFPVPLGKSLEIRANLPLVAKEIMAKKGTRVLLEQPWVKVERLPVKEYQLIPKEGKEGEYDSIVVGEKMQDTILIDQIAAMISALSANPHTRRAQAITWQPWEDLTSYDPACLQSVWMRALPGKDGKLRLNTDVRFRSRDAYDAAFMNMFFLINQSASVAEQIAQKRGEEVLVGRYFDLSDAYHIYGRRLDHFRENFMKQVEQRSFKDRTWTREFANEIFEEAKPKIKAKIKAHDNQ